YWWALYQHDQDTLNKLTRVMRADGGEPPNIHVVTTSLHAVMQFLRSGPYLACLADAYLSIMPERDIEIVPFRREILSFPSGALYDGSLRGLAPLSALSKALRPLLRTPRCSRTSSASEL